MLNTLQSLTEKLFKNDNDIDVYNKLSKIFEENNMYLEQSDCLEKICHITQNYEYLKQIGDILLFKVKNKKMAFETYNKYLQFSQPDFYKNYVYCANNLDSKTIINESRPKDTNNEIVKLCNQYFTIISILKLLLKLNKYENLIEFVNNYLFKIEQQINLKIHENKENLKYLKEINEYSIYLSEQLSTVLHNNDINFLAIRFNPQNLRAYINIIDDYITYEKYNECLQFYNKDFYKIFNKKQCDTISDICFVISDYFREQNNFYKTLFYQKKAIEINTLRG